MAAAMVVCLGEGRSPSCPNPPTVDPVLFVTLAAKCSQIILCGHFLLSHLPKSELIAKYLCINVAEVIDTNSSPLTVVKNLQTSYVWHTTSYQSHGA